MPRPRFRLANQRPSATRRSLLVDFNAVEDFSDDGSLHLEVDSSFNVSSLIKAHVQPGYHRQQQQQLREWGMQKHGGRCSYQVGRLGTCKGGAFASMLCIAAGYLRMTVL